MYVCSFVLYPTRLLENTATVTFYVYRQVRYIHIRMYAYVCVCMYVCTFVMYPRVC